jgi:hypothetical protein
MGQNRKGSMRANVFRCIPENGHGGRAIGDLLKNNVGNFCCEFLTRTFAIVGIGIFIGSMIWTITAGRNRLSFVVNLDHTAWAGNDNIAQCGGSLAFSCG